MTTNDATTREADRAVPEPDTDAVERAAKAIFREVVGSDWEAVGKRVKDTYRRMARAALAAAGDDLDAMLDSVNEDALLKLSAKGEAEWTAKVTWRNEKDHWVHSEGTGPTRMAAIQDAVRQATGAEGDEG